MADTKGKNYQLLTCPVCEGSGEEAAGDCQRCRGRGQFAWLEGEWLVWRKPIDTLHIFERNIERTINGLINGLLVLFGLGGVAMAGLTIYAMSEQGMELTDFWQRRNGLMALFALSLVTDLYAYYRMQRQTLLRGTVRRKPFESETTLLEPTELFEQALRAPIRAVTDISRTFTNEAETVIEAAWQLARKMKHPQASPIHLLASMLSDQQIRVVFGRLGIDGNKLVAMISRSLARLSRREESGQAGTAPSFNAVLVRAYAEAYFDKRERVDIPQLLKACVFVDELTRDIFYDLEIEQEEIINVVEWINIRHRLSGEWRQWRNKAAYKTSGPMNRSMTARATPLLDRFSHDLTSLAQRGVLAPCIGRDREIEETLRIMEGGKNVILSGFPGVGKTSIIEGIAELMASEEVPEVLQDKRLVSISIASLVGAAGRQGELEGLFLELTNEIVASGNIVVVIDNLQNMVGVSTQGAQNLDISEMLANALQKRLFYCISTTTPPDFRRYIEPRGTLTTVFQKVAVDEPDTNAAIQVLEGKSGAVEYKNKVFFSYDAIARMVKLSQRYLHERYLPEKALGLMEEVAVYTRKKRGVNSIVTGEDVAEIVSSQTNVPVTKLSESETTKLLNLEEIIHQRMVNQEEAVKAVASALRRARAELRDVKRPIVNLLFLGPTGVGKTELAKTVADVYFGSEDNMIRLDMSEYQEQSSLNRLIGAPPGYQGSGQGGYLTEAVRTKPFSLLLLDEIEKAHPDILNIFLQVMDDGRLTDTMGRTIDFTNVILIATSNAGSQLIQQRIREQAKVDQIKDELMNQGLQQYFRPEFLNRFDNIVVFKPLSFEHIVQIVDLMLKRVSAMLAAKGVRFEATQAAKEELAQTGYDPVFGARPLRRAIQDTVDNALANYLLQGKIGRRDVAVMEAGGKITVKRAAEL